MVANIRGYTPNYGLKLINFDTPRWHTLEYSNWELVDAIMASTGLPGLRGEWINSTTYVVGERVFDNADGKIYGCLVSHTSAATGTFAQDRIAHPDYWMLQTLDTPRYRGGWAPSVAYSVADIVFVNSYVYYICIANHTSSTTFPPDAVKWSVVFDATAAVNTTNASATAAAGSASAAATSATNAATSATNAQASAVESAAQAAKLYGTSTSSVVVGVGGKSFTTQASKYFNVGKFIMVRADADPVNQWMWGQVTSYSGTSLVINSMTSGGAGTYAAWTIDVSGSQGAIGPQGPQGELGPPLVIKGTVPTASALPPTGNTIGDMYIAEDTQNLHIWDGTTWDNAGPLGTSTTTTADAPPSNPKDGDMWWESDTGIFWVRYDDGNSAQWIQAGGAAASINQNAVLKTGDTMTGALNVDAINTGGAAPSPYPSSVVTYVMSAPFIGHNVYLDPTASIWRARVSGFSTLVASNVSDGKLTWLIGANAAAGASVSFTAKMELLPPGDFKLYSTTASTSPTTGALTVAGGLGVGGTIYSSAFVGYGVTSGLLVNAHYTDTWRALTTGISAYVGLENAMNRFSIYTAPSASAGAAITMTPSLHINTIDKAVSVLSTVASTSPTSGALTVAGGLGVGGSVSSGKLIYAEHDSSIDWAMYTKPTSTSIGTGPIFFMNNVGGGAGSISYTAGQTGVAYNTSSDARLKEDLKSFDAGNIIDNTNVYDFKWRSTEERAYGIIAQQAVQVYPQAITHTEASTEKGAERDEWWGVDYSKYVPVLLQELKALRERVAILEGRPTTPTAPKGRK